ncbi:NADPH:quinone reductase [Jiangella rhizosphaerae]|uniref:NADPH:quinone reductase n=1 Tax=Jiangella rhizosphaerae TaxID=2293569 RepID=A0A418KM63_9ACTN|nr:NADPH:quinone reductase [Jiangella rhizosphaerae]RIQ19473.1 NADPH:quinone reductase [Jiangella rhizosphaerae]
MKAIVHDESGPADVLRLSERPVPDPGPGEVRVRIAVSGVNPTDWKSRSGGYGAFSGTESVPNQDGSGVIDAVGDGVGGLAVGDRVWVTLAAHERPDRGTAQEYTVVPVERVFVLPDGAGFELGAAVGIPAITAHRALTVAEDGPERLSPGALDGRVVLVAGGAGAVGNAAIQLARWAGATVIATVSSDAKGALATAAGAHHVVRYGGGADVAAAVRSIAADGVDLVVEVAAGANAATDTAVLKPRGTVAIYANNGDVPFNVNVREYMGLNARLQFVLLYTVGWDKLRAAGDDVNAAIAAGAFRIGGDAGLPLHHFTLEQTADAHRAVEDGATGKVLITVADA